MSNIYRSRIDRMLIQTAGSPFITSKLEDLFYFSGFTGDFGYLVLSNPKSYLITTKMFLNEVNSSVDTSIFDVRLVDKSKIFSELIDILIDIQSPEIFICSTNAGVSNFIKVIDTAKDKRLFGLNKKLLSLRDDHFSVGNVKIYFREYLSDKVRSVKDENELNILRNNLLLSDEGFLYILKFIKPGVTEREISIEMEYYLKLKGADEMSFQTIVASGIRSSMPHGRASNKVISNGEPIVIDFGIKKDMYCTDTTRTVFLGTPTQKMKDVYNIVLEALNEGIAYVRSGIKIEDLDKRVRSVIEKYGYGEYFTHSTGHGVGLEIHEYPFISKDNEDELKEGMVVTIEPGIYIPNEFGVRIENMVFVKKNSSEVLTSLTTDMIIL
ncbi:MAG: aminopeptidase P family protein [Brevinematales bacterium]|nr:aminopeptidase P family protein [Brevinematales bacterium]